jgi:hypothetical protein
MENLPPLFETPTLDSRRAPFFLDTAGGEDYG